MDANGKNSFEPSTDSAFVMSQTSFSAVVKAAFGTPLRVVITIATATIIILGSILIWSLVIAPVVYPHSQSAVITVLNDDGSKGLAPSLEKPFRCSPEFPFKNDASRQVGNECKR